LQKMQQMDVFIHQLKEWLHFSWKIDELVNLLSEVRNLQGRLLGRMESLGFDLRNEATLDTLTLDVLKSTEIEGEILNAGQVRSSIARRLGMEIAGSVDSDRNIDGMVEMMIDATQRYDQLLTVERLFDWHAALFPTGRSGMYKITVAN
jgi:Fic family protein